MKLTLEIPSEIRKVTYSTMSLLLALSQEFNLKETPHKTSCRDAYGSAGQRQLNASGVNIVHIHMTRKSKEKARLGVHACKPEGLRQESHELKATWATKTISKRGWGWGDHSVDRIKYLPISSTPRARVWHKPSLATHACNPSAGRWEVEASPSLD